MSQAEHGVHSDDPGGEKWPMSHGMQAEAPLPIE